MHRQKNREKRSIPKVDNSLKNGHDAFKRESPKIPCVRNGAGGGVESPSNRPSNRNRFLSIDIDPIDQNEHVDRIDPSESISNRHRIAIDSIDRYRNRGIDFGHRSHRYRSHRIESIIDIVPYRFRYQSGGWGAISVAGDL